jgi:CshA-type fibril repeat protein
VLINDTDGDNPMATTVIITNNGATNAGKQLVVATEGTWQVDGTTGIITFSPNNGYAGNPTLISYTVNDNEGNTSNVATIKLTATPKPNVIISGSAPKVF